MWELQIYATDCKPSSSLVYRDLGLQDMHTHMPNSLPGKMECMRVGEEVSRLRASVLDLPISPGARTKGPPGLRVAKSPSQALLLSRSIIMDF